MRALLSGLIVLSVAGLSRADDWPAAKAVEAQPLLAQAKRVAQALDQLGQPLPEAAKAALNGLKESDGNEAITASIQKIFDPLCLAAVDIGADGVAKVVPSEGAKELVEQGWRIFLVKALNPNGSKEQLRAMSSSALPVPTGPKEEIENRWLSLTPFTAQPLLANLSGLGLEYTVLQVYSRDMGKKSADIAFYLDTGKKGAKPGKSASAKFDFHAAMSVVVKFQVSEVDGTPTTAAFLIRDAAGREYPSRSKRLAPDFFFQQQIYRSTGESVRIPPGQYTIRCNRGPESIPEMKTLVVGEKEALVSYTVRRWIDPSTRGWWSGDHHIHAAGCAHYEKPTEGVHPPDMLRHIVGEDLKVGCCLTWGPCFDYQKRFFTGKPDDVSKYPYILRYDVEVSGFGSHQSGHLNLLKLKEQIPPGGDSKQHWPTLGMNTLRWAKKQGGITGPAHSGNGLTRTIGRIDGATDGPFKLPNYNIPAYDGIGANEFVVQAALNVPGPDGNPVPAVDFISAMDTDRVAEWNMWYHTLNCGFRVKASGETDFPCISGERVGMGRVYVKVDGKLDFDRWVDGIAAGRSYVSDGLTHLMDFTASANGTKYELGMKGSEIKLEKAGAIKFGVHAAAYYPGRETVPVELLVNGLPVAKTDLKCDGETRELSFDASIEKSSWVALRVFPSAHTNPFFVEVGGKPIRASKHSAEWCLAGVEQCWKSKQNTYKPQEQDQAAADYALATKIYKKILEESGK